jgi:hypothetical protein
MKSPRSVYSDVMSEAEAGVSSDYKTVINLEETASNNRDYKTAKWARRRAETIAEKQVPSFLSRKAAIPNVPSVDLSATVAHSENHVIPPIVLYDDVPGGAGIDANFKLEVTGNLSICISLPLTS